MKISKIIRSVYECASPEEGIASAENRLLKNRFLVVMDHDDEFRGIITTHDIVQSPYQLIEDCLSPKLRLGITDSIESVLANMRETGSFVLPVFDDGKFIGVIVETDIIESLIEHRDNLTKTIVEKNDDLSRINALLYSESEKHKAVQEDKKRTEDMLSLITANMSDMIVLTDTNGILQYYSPSHTAIMGYGLKEEVGKSIFDFVHPEDMERVECVFKEAVVTSTPGRVEYRVRHADGHYILVETISNFARDEKDRIKGVILTSRDITQRKRAEEALRESEEKYRVLFETAKDAIFLSDETGKFVDVNQAACESLGYSKEELLKLSNKGLDTDPNGYEAFMKVRDGLVKGVTFEVNQRKKDGTFFPVEIAGCFFDSGSSRLALAIARDITERKHMEAALFESKERLSQIVEGTSIPVFVIDKKHTVTHWNRACENITGIPADEVIGTTNQWSAFYSGARPVMADLIVDEAPEEEIPRYYGDKYQKAVLVEGAYEAEDFFPDINESGRWLFFTAAPLRDHDGKITGAIETLQDFTDRRNAEEELKTSRYHIALINKMLRHDVTNDLAVIRSALRLYEESGEERLLREASDRVGKSVDLIRRMRELEIFISSRGDLKLYNIGSTLKEVMKSYPSIQFTIEGRGQVLADDALSSVIDNIISNAAIHGKADRLEVKIKKVRDMYEVRIADNGIGIPDEIKGQIFEEDFAHGETAHTGMGLYIVKKTIENYGGSVRVEDNTPKGAVFVLKLKCVK